MVRSGLLQAYQPVTSLLDSLKSLKAGRITVNVKLPGSLQLEAEASVGTSDHVKNSSEPMLQNNLLDAEDQAATCLPFELKSSDTKAIVIEYLDQRRKVTQFLHLTPVLHNLYSWTLC